MDAYRACLALLRRPGTKSEGEGTGEDREARGGASNPSAVVAEADALARIGSVHLRRRELDEARAMLRQSERLYGEEAGEIISSLLIF